MIKLIVFDFDGVLADCKEIHYHSLNKALDSIDSKYSISLDEHVKTYDGLSTKKKLNMLVKHKDLPSEHINTIADLKQKHTMTLMRENLSFDLKLDLMLHALKSEGYQLYVASNAIRETLIAGLHKLGVLHYFDKIFSNQDVSHQKPHPEIYLKCMVDAGAMPSETLIVEDSRHGREAAVQSGASICGVDNPEDLTYTRIKEAIARSNNPKSIRWAARENLTVLIPMSGAGSRFAKEGYKLPKPLIDVDGQPMIQKVIENLNMDANYIFIVQKAHYDQYNLGVLLPLIAPGCKIVQSEGLTEGAACSTLLAKEYIDNDKHLLIANSDQYLEWDACDFMYNMLCSNVDGGIITFKADDNKWSYARTNEYGYVEEVKEKEVISEDATVGLYYWSKGSDYVKYAERMIEKDIRVNNEYYVCPVYNEAIEDGKKIKIYDIKAMWGIGTPSDLNFFLENFKK